MTLPIHWPYAPMEAKRVDRIPTGDVWQFEPKWDGFRAIVFRDGEEVYVQSKASQPLARYFPEVVEAARALKQKQFVLDGEIAESMPAHYYVFDLLALKTKDFTNLPVEERREKLEAFFETIKHELMHLSPATQDRKLATQWFDKFDWLLVAGSLR